MKIFNSLVLCSLKYYSKELFLQSCYHNQIEIEDFIEVDKYTYRFKTSYSNYKKLSKYYTGIEIIKKYGFLSLVELIKTNKLLSVLLIICLCFYLYLNKHIYQIEINGVSNQINSYIREKLKEFEIDKYQYMPQNSDLKEIENILKMDLMDSVDLLSITSKGTYIFVNYTKKGDLIELEKKNGKIYAKKDGIIKSFQIDSGKILCDVNDYVKKGDLLVDDYLYYKDKPIYVGTKGEIYAYTFNKISLSCVSKGLEKSEIYHLLLTKARYEVSKSFDANSYIDKELIVSYINQNDVANMTIHYTLVENIVSFS